MGEIKEKNKLNVPLCISQDTCTKKLMNTQNQEFPSGNNLTWLQSVTEIIWKNSSFPRRQVKSPS